MLNIKISIIVPTYNAENNLPKLMQCLHDQLSGDDEIIIIDSSSNDSTVDIAKRYTDNIIVIPQSEFDHGGTRAFGAKAASGDILVFMTQDALPYDNNTINNIIKVFDNNKIGAAYGRQISYPDTNIFGKHIRMFNYGKESYVRSYDDKNTYGIKTIFLSDSFAAYRKQALEKIDYFKPDLILGEDSYAGAKLILAGYSLAYCADAIVYHSHSYTIFEEFKRYFDIGVFHKCEKWILDSFGKAEGEGGRYVKSEIKYLLENGEWLQVPSFFLRNAMKYLGYKLGQNYSAIPNKIISKISMHSKWWEKHFK